MKFRALLAVCSALVFLALPCQGAIYLELEGIPGESTDEQRPRTIEIDSFSFGASNSGSIVVGGGGGGAGKVSFQDISLSKKLDKASPLLYLACAQGTHIKRAVLFVRKAGDKPMEYYTITLSDLLISSVQTGGSTGGDRPTESLSLNFTKIEFSYAAQKPDGSLETPVTSGWDIANNLPL
jgi:type VI secretion system secreted protein Hcp